MRFRKATRSGARHLQLREAGLVEERDRVPARERLGSDGRAPVLARPAAGPERLVAEPPRSARTSSAAPTCSSRRRHTRASASARRPATVGAGARHGAPRSGSGCRSRSSTPRRSRATARSRLRYCGPNRRMSIFQVSKPGSPSRIHSAITRPTPPAPAMPCAQNPAATKNPSHLALAQHELVVGREALRPVDELDDVGRLGRGHPPAGSVMRGAKRSQSSARSRLLKSSGTPSTDHGAGSRS